MPSMIGFWQGLRIVTLSAVLLFFVWLGAKGGIDGLREAESAGQRVVAGVRIVYSIAATGVLWALWRQSWWLELSLVIWGVMLSVAAALTQVVSGGAGWISGVYNGIIAAGVASLVAWSCMTHAKLNRRRNATRISYYA